MKVLIVGGAGAIGSYLAWHFQNIGAEVLLSDVWDGELKNSQLHWIEHNLRPHLYVPPVGASRFPDFIGPIDAIINAAGLSRTDRTISDYWMANVVVPSHLAELAAKRDIPFVHCSSASVYGNGRNPNREDDDPEPLRGGVHGLDYGRSKLAGERAIRAVKRVERSGARDATLIMRLFNVYCPNEHHKRGYCSPTFRMASLVHCDPEARFPVDVHFDKAGRLIARDHVSVVDVAEVVTQWLGRALQGEVFDWDTVNVGSGSSLTFLDAFLASYRAIAGNGRVPTFNETEMAFPPGYQFTTEASVERLRLMNLPIPNRLSDALSPWLGAFRATHSDGLLTRLYGAPGAQVEAIEGLKQGENGSAITLGEAIARVLRRADA